MATHISAIVLLVINIGLLWLLMAAPLNLLPMNRFDGGQVLRQVFRSRASLMTGSFLITFAILGVGWRIGVPSAALLAGLAVFALLGMIGQGGLKPRHRLDE